MAEKPTTRSANLQIDDALIQRVVDKLPSSSIIVQSDNIKELLAPLREEVAQSKNKISQLKQINDDLEQYTRQNSLRIYGVPEQQGENTDLTVIQICREKLKINLTLDMIDVSHRLPGKEGVHKPIIVKFVSRNTKKSIYNKKRMLKNSKIVIAEDLTKRRNQLLKEAKRRLGHKNAWSSDCKIFVKYNNDIKRISSMNDLI